MSGTTFLVCQAAWILLVICTSYELWINPREWQRKRSNFRARLNRTWLRFLTRSTRVYDEDPKREVREYKVFFVIMYLSLVVWFILILTGLTPGPR